MAYGFANAYTTTLNGAIDSSVTSLSVSSDLPSALEVPFMARIDNEYVRVTAVSGTGNRNWTVTRGAEEASRFPAAAHSDGANVNHVLTAGALAEIAQIAQGTAFPSSPQTNDRFFRTDRGLDYFYDGTRWLTTTLYQAPFSGSDRGITTITATTNHYSQVALWAGQYDLYLVDYVWQINVATTNDGSNYWNWVLQKLEATGTTGATITTPTSSALSTGWSAGRTSINAVHSNVGSLRNNVNKIGSPGAFAGLFAITYRLVG